MPVNGRRHLIRRLKVNKENKAGDLCPVDECEMCVLNRSFFRNIGAVIVVCVSLSESLNCACALVFLLV